MSVSLLAEAISRASEMQECPWCGSRSHSLTTKCRSNSSPHANDGLGLNGPGSFNYETQGMSPSEVEEWKQAMRDFYLPKATPKKEAI